MEMRLKFNENYFYEHLFTTYFTPSLCPLLSPSLWDDETYTGM